MASVAEIEARAAVRHGGPEMLNARLAHPRPREEIVATPPDRWLAEATRCIFQAGFSWQLIDRKWPAFEDAFEGFDIHRWSMMSEDDLDRLLKTEGLVANAAKLRSVGGNATFFRQILDEAGSIGAWFADWPATDYFGLLDLMKKRGNRLGGRTGQIFLRRMGVDSLVLSADVCAALIAAGIVDREPKTKGELRATQDALDAWMAESGRPMTQISQILGLSADA